MQAVLCLQGIYKASLSASQHIMQPLLFYFSVTLTTYEFLLHIYSFHTKSQPRTFLIKKKYKYPLVESISSMINLLS